MHSQVKRAWDTLPKQTLAKTRDCSQPAARQAVKRTIALHISQTSSASLAALQSTIHPQRALEGIRVQTQASAFTLATKSFSLSGPRLLVCSVSCPVPQASRILIPLALVD